MNTRQSAKKTPVDDLSNLEIPIAFNDDVVSRLWRLLDKKMSEQTECINRKILNFSALLKEGEARLAADIKATVKEAEDRLLCEFEKRLCEIRGEMNRITDRVTKLETVTGEIMGIKDEIKKLKIQSLKHSNSMVACDLRISGIPFCAEEDLTSLFDAICRIIKISTPPVQFIHRLQNKNNKNDENSPDGVIIAKLMTPYDKNTVLKAINIYRKENKNLTLSLLGFHPHEKNQHFYIHENLTNGNYKIFRKAVALKKQKVLQSAYSFRGIVYVKRLSTDKPFCVESLEALNSFFRSRRDESISSNCTISGTS